jgi:type I restriction enzyme S subunit
VREGWQVKPLKEVCQYQRGLTYTKSDEVEYSSNIVLRANNIDLGTHSLNLSDLKYISDDVVVSQSKRVRPGSLLICTASGSKSHLGKVAFIDQDYGCAFGGFMGQITPKKEVEERFLFYVLTSSIYKKYIDELSDGVNINNLKYDQLGEFPVIVPPLPEQRRIVAILDEAFEGIATAKANAEKNLQNAREVFESHLNAVFSQRGEGWVNIGAVGDVFDGPHATPKTVDNGPIFLGIGALSNGKLNLGETRHVSLEDYKQWTRRVTPRSGDIVFSYETRLGQAAIIPDNLECCLGRRMGLFRANQQKILPTFFIYQYISPPFQEFINTQIVRGATVDRISIKDFPSFPVWVPSIDEQQRIGSMSAAMSEETQHLESIYQQKLTALDELKQSLLHQAFNGDL